MIITDHHEDRAFTREQELNEKYGKKVTTSHRMDVTNKNEVEEIFSRYDAVDILINNAGISLPNKESGKNYDKENWDETLRINLTAHFTCSQEVIKYMKKQKTGSIINITSINAELGFPRNPSYVASKGGLKMLGKALAKDWGKYGIRVNNLGPGLSKQI